MNHDLNYTEYNEEKNRVPWGRLVLSLLTIVLAVIIVLLFLKGCGKTSLRNDLIKSGKDYHEINPNSLPTEIGECNKVTLATLEKENLIKKNKYETCDKEKTYVNVCYLESKTYHYSAILKCQVETTDYDVWKDGTEANLTENSDVRFKYLGEQKKTGTKYYYPNNLTDVTKVNEYYASIPSDDYTGKEVEQEGYKWYVEKTVNDYWQNGAYSSTQPSGYTKKGKSTTVTNISDTRPSEASYRKIEETKMYRYRKTAYALIYCSSDTLPGVMSSTTPCHLRGDEYSEFVKMEFTCGDGSSNVGKTDDTVCADYTAWTTKSCEGNNPVTTGIECESKTSYSYTDTKWQWYKNTTVKSYYPSGSASADKENTYYITAPISGAIKDVSTKANVNKYYKLEDSKENTNYEEWIQVTDGYVMYEELIETFNNLGYEVNGLKDINSLDAIRYQYKLQYRNIEE